MVHSRDEIGNSPAVVTTRPKKASAGSYGGPVVDCDVHHSWVSQSDLIPYLSAGWKEYISTPSGGQIPMNVDLSWPNPTGGNRSDAYPDGSAPPGSSYEMMRDQLLDKWDVRKAVLTHGGILFGLNRLRNPYFAIEVMRAANEWTAECWLEADERFAGSILISNHVPAATAKEIRRAGKDQRFCQVLISGNAIGQPLGHPLYHPIYEAALEIGKPLAIHGGSDALTYPAGAGGFLNFYLEFHTLRFTPILTNVVSLILHGVFEKYPDLKVALVESGIAWIPALMWRLDEDYKGVRREVPWLRRLPSEYFKDHFFLTTQPLEMPSKREELIDLIGSVGAQDSLMYSSDYPHWDADEVDHTARRLPKEWHERLFWRTAADLYGWDEELFLKAG